MTPFVILAIAFFVALAVIIGPITIGISLRKRFDRSANRLGTAVSDVGATLDRLLEQQERANRRLENLETIVTSVDWDRVTDPAAESPPLEIPDETEPEQETERIARRVR